MTLLQSLPHQKGTLTCLTIVFLIFLFPENALGQLSISSTVPGSGGMDVCKDSSDFSFTITATSGSVTGVTLDIHMPPGITYLPGTLTNSGSKSVSYASWSGNVLTLSGADMVLSDHYDFTFKAYADCDAMDFFLAANTLQDTINIQYNGSQFKQDSTSDFNNAIAYPELSISQPSTPSATIGQTVTRNVTVFNSGSGCLESFFWYDVFENDITVDSIYFNGSKLNATVSNDTIYYTFSSAEFSMMGDFSDDFCLADGGLTLTEYITLTGCTNKGSDIGASWGCGGETCSGYTTTGDVSLTTQQPYLTFNFRYEDMIACFHEQPNRKEMIIANNGSGTATNIEVEIKKYFYGGQFEAYKYDGLDHNSVELKYNNGSFASVTPKNIQMNTYYNTCSQPYAYRFTVEVPDLAAGDSAVIGFDMINCVPDECGEGEISQGAWGYNYRYEVPCGGSATIVSNYRASVGSDMTFNVSNYDNPTVADGQSINLTTTIETADISYPGSGKYIIRYVLPSCGITFSGDSTDLTWKNISGNETWPQASFSYTNDTVLAYYSVSDQPTDFSLNGADIVLNVEGDCSCAGGSSSQQLEKSILYIPEESCTTQAEIELSCETLDITADLCDSNPCDGLRISDFTFLRSNYGLPDNDLNRQPEAGSVDLNLIRTDRVRLGDTLSASLEGYISGATTFSHAYATLAIDVADYLTALDGSVTIWDASTSSYISCDTLPVRMINDSVYQYVFTGDTLGVKCPSLAGFQFAPGDSVWIYPKFRVTSTSNNSLDIGIVNPVKMYVSQIASPGLADQYTCGSAQYSSKIQIVPMSDQSSATETGGVSCNNSTSRVYINMFTGGSYTDMFPAEYRTWSYPDTFRVVKPENFTYAGSYIFLRFSPYTKTTSLAPVNTAADTLIFDLKSLIDNGTLILPDDGYELQFFTYWSPTCESAQGTSVPVPVLSEFRWDNGLDAYDTTRTYSSSVRHTAPELSVSNVSATSQDGVSSEVSWTINVSNSSGSSASSNTFLSFASTSGEITVTGVTDDGAGGASVTTSGGIYQLGTIGTSTSKSYTITANYGSCSLDTLYVYAGWNCGGYPASIGDYPCALDTFLLKVDPKPGNAQLNVNSTPANPVTICTDLTYDLQVSSVQMANVEDIVIDIIHPGGGIDFVTGSAELEYPLNSGYATISDPASVTGGFRFTMADYDATLADQGLEGLAGSDANDRGLNIRFDVKTNCDFISGDAFYVRMTGTRPCGDPITVIRVMDPVVIDGAAGSYSTSIATSVSDFERCGTGNEGDVAVNIKPVGGSTSGSDYIYITIPSGFTYSSGSFSGLHNSPSVTTPSSTSLGALGTRLEWEMPNGISPSDSIYFGFRLEADHTTGCSSSEHSLNVNTVFSASVTCEGVACADYFASTGTSSAFITLDKPALTVSYLAFNASPVGASDHIFGVITTLGNTSVFDIDGSEKTTVEYYCDVDSSGSYSAGDNYIGMFSEYITIPAGDYYTLMDTFTTPSSNCNGDYPLLAIIRATPENAGGVEQCLCDTMTQYQSSDIWLPVSWIYVGGKPSGQGNLLQWQVNPDPASSRFMIERFSPQVNHWKVLGEEKIDKQGGITQTYRFQDPEPYETSVYRIRHEYLDGTVDFSPRFEVIRQNPASVSVFPNPTKGAVTISANLPVNYELWDVRGKTLTGGTLAKGENPVSFSGYPQGVYLLKVRSGNITEVIKLVID